MSSSPLVADALHSRGRRIALYVLLGLVSLLYLFVGGQKVIGTERMMANMAEIHYPAWAMRLIGLVEMTAALALWWRRSRTLALSALILVMAGAAGSHIAAGHSASQIAPVFAFAGVLGLTFIVDRGRGLWRFLFRNSEPYVAKQTTTDARVGATAS